MESGNGYELSCNENVGILNQRFHDAARLSIPMSSGQVMQSMVPWWTNQCTHVTRERKLAQRRYQHTKRICDIMAYNRAHAVAQRTRLLARQTSWNDYLSTINSTTAMVKIWDRIAKMSGKYKAHKMPPILHNNNLVSDHKQVSNSLADHYESVSSSANYSNEFREVKQNKKMRPLDFTVRAQEMNGALKTMQEIGYRGGWDLL